VGVLATAFAWSVPGWAWTLPMSVLRPGCKELLGFFFSSPLRIPQICVLHCAFFLYFVHFYLFPSIDMQNTFSHNTSGTRSIIYACVKVCLFLLFWTIIGSSNCVIVTTNNTIESVSVFRIDSRTIKRGNLWLSSYRVPLGEVIHAHAFRDLVC
jgi:hypothetical protein